MQQGYWQSLHVQALHAAFISKASQALLCRHGIGRLTGTFSVKRMWCIP